MGWTVPLEQQVARAVPASLRVGCRRGASRGVEGAEPLLLAQLVQARGLDALLVAVEDAAHGVVVHDHAEEPAQVVGNNGEVHARVHPVQPALGVAASPCAVRQPIRQAIEVLPQICEAILVAIGVATAMRVALRGRAVANAPAHRPLCRLCCQRILAAHQ